LRTTSSPAPARPPPPAPSANLADVPGIVVASDAPSLRREIVGIVDGPEITTYQAVSGPAAIAAVQDYEPDLLIVDMQMSNMGGMAVCLELRLQETYTDLAHVPVLMLLDRRPDVFLARRSGAEGWLVKPIDPIRLRRACRALTTGGTYQDASYQPVPVLVSREREPTAPSLPGR
jgi:DNA-binding response OmpR family regulator